MTTRSQAMPTPWQSSWLNEHASELTALVWRGVEAQHVVSTMRLVDDTDEQLLLEQLLEGSKPTIPATHKKATKHYLLSTPFRYRPMHASRFRPANSAGQWYGCERLLGACAEVAYWRHRFVTDSEAFSNAYASTPLLTSHTFFQAQVKGRAIDLSAVPWNAQRDTWRHSSNYESTQELAKQAQDAGIDWIRYESAREAQQHCAAVFNVNALGEPRKGLDATQQTWHCKTTVSSVMLVREDQHFTWQFAATG